MPGVERMISFPPGQSLGNIYQLVFRPTALERPGTFLLVWARMWRPASLPAPRREPVITNGPVPALFFSGGFMNDKTLNTTEQTDKKPCEELRLGKGSRIVLPQAKDQTAKQTVTLSGKFYVNGR
jgi:hypothetical protein